MAETRSCVEVRADGEIIILDAGSGIRLLGLALDKEFGPRSMKLTLLISHTHWDHIQGLPFFSPAYNQKNLIRVLGYEGARAGLAKILASQMETPFFPVSLRELPSHLAIEELRETDFQIGKVEVRSKFANHPGICAGYRLFTSSGSIAYFPDNEPYETLKLHLASRDGITEEEARDFAAAERGKDGRVSPGLRPGNHGHAIYRRGIREAHWLGPQLTQQCNFPRARLKRGQAPAFPSRSES